MLCITTQHPGWCCSHSLHLGAETGETSLLFVVTTSKVFTSHPHDLMVCWYRDLRIKEKYLYPPPKKKTPNNKDPPDVEAQTATLCWAPVASESASKGLMLWLERLMLITGRKSRDTEKWDTEGSLGHLNTNMFCRLTSMENCNSSKQAGLLVAEAFQE